MNFKNLLKNKGPFIPISIIIILAAIALAIFKTGYYTGACIAAMLR